MYKVLFFLFLTLGFSLLIKAQNNKKNVLSDSLAIDSLQLENGNTTMNITNLLSDSNKKLAPLTTYMEPQLIINQDKRIELLNEQYLKEKTTRGYKIQLYSSHSRWEAEKAKSTFMAQYSKLPTPELLYQTPNFKIRFGNFRNRFEAEKYMKKIKENYPSAFLVKDEISVKLK